MAELTEITQELNELKIVDVVQGSANKKPYQRRSVPVSGLPSNGRVISLLDRQAELRARKGRVERFIHSIPDWQTRRMFEMKFIEGKKYHQIARELGGGMSADCVRKRICRQI